MASKKVIVISFLLGILAIPMVSAYGADDLSEEVKELQQKVEALSNRVAEQEGNSSKAVEALIPDWISMWKLKGDLRYRYEYIDMEDSVNRNRNRIRARIGIEGKVNDNVKLGFQLASGSDDPVSTNTTLDSGFSSKDIYLDLAYFDWTVSNVDGLHVIGGKMKNPFAQPVGNSDLVWDGDLRPEGAAVVYKTALADNVDFFGSAGGFYVEERSSEADSSLWAAQAGAKINFPDCDGAYLKFGGSYYTYGNAKGNASFFDDEDSFGNTVDGDGNYAEDFDILEGFAEIGGKVAGVPVSVFGNVVENTGASSNNTGWLAGIGVGKCKKPGDWEVVYNYRRLEKDAVIGAFSDSDFIGGGTDGKGHKFSAAVQVAKNVKVGATYFMNEVGLSDSKDFDRVQLDVAFAIK